MNKIQDFQKRLILKTEELVVKSLKITNQEQEILNIKQEIERRPGIEEAKKLSMVQQALKSKTRQIKVGLDLILIILGFISRVECV
jgi:quinolinate synthase